MYLFPKTMYTQRKATARSASSLTSQYRRQGLLSRWVPRPVASVCDHNVVGGHRHPRHGVPGVSSWSPSALGFPTIVSVTQVHFASTCMPPRNPMSDDLIRLAQDQNRRENKTQTTLQVVLFPSVTLCWLTSVLKYWKPWTMLTPAIPTGGPERTDPPKGLHIIYCLELLIPTRCRAPSP